MIKNDIYKEYTCDKTLDHSFSTMKGCFMEVNEAWASGSLSGSHSLMHGLLRRVSGESWPIHTVTNCVNFAKVQIVALQLVKTFFFYFDFFAVGGVTVDLVKGSS